MRDGKRLCPNCPSLPGSVVMRRWLYQIIRRARGLVKAAAAALLLLGVLLLTRAVPVEQLHGWLTARVEALGPAGPVLFGLLYVVLTLALIPGLPLTVAAGAA